MTSPTTPVQALDTIDGLDADQRANWRLVGPQGLRALTLARSGWTEVERLTKDLDRVKESAAEIVHASEARAQSAEAKAQSLAENLQRVTDHLAIWARDHSMDRTAETDAALFCAREALASYRRPQGEAHQLLTDLPGDEL